MESCIDPIYYYGKEKVDAAAGVITRSLQMNKLSVNQQSELIFQTNKPITINPADEYLDSHD